MAQQLEVQQIPLVKTKVSKFNVRTDVGDISELVLSIKSVGVLEPVVARPIGREFEVIIGSRRLAAARKAGLKSIPAIVKRLSDDQAILESLTENLQRGDLTEEEIVKAYNILHNFDPKRWTQDAFARKVGKSQQWIAGLLAAYHLVVKLKKAGVVRSMSSYPREEEKERGVAPVGHLRRIEEAVSSLANSGALTEKEADKKRIELAKETLDLPQEDLQRVINRVKMYPEKPIEKVKEEALGGIAVKTYIPAKVARQMEETTGRPVGEALTQVLERGLSAPPTISEEKAPMKHWADELTQDPISVQVANWWKWNRDRINGEFDFYTTHYSGKDLDTFIETLKTNGVKRLVDVRDTPFSQFRPEFNKEGLAKTLKAKGITYLHHPELGVPREQRDRLAKSGNWSELFQWYDKNVVPKVNEAFDHEDINSKETIAFMCVEKDPTKCHRHRIALALEKTGSKSLDL